MEEDSDVYGSLDPSLTLLMHGVETDWIEEEMADDDDFRSSLHFPKKADDEDFRSYSHRPKSIWNNNITIKIKKTRLFCHHIFGNTNSQREERLREEKGR